MNPNIAANQQRLFLDFIFTLRPHFRRDSGLPRRIKELLARQRSIGSRDRKLYRELIYTTLRFLPWIEPYFDQAPALAAKITAWLAPELKPTSHYRSVLCSDWPAAPESLAAKAALLSTLVAQHHVSSPNTPTLPGQTPPLEASSTGPVIPARAFSPEALLPAWFREHCPAAFQPPHLDSLNTRAAVWVRLQIQDRNLVLDEFRGQHWMFEISAEFPDAICLPPNAEVAASEAYRRGFLEIQDLGSQLVLAHASVIPGGRWLDACAGAGGKTLQLARLVGPTGSVEATDIRSEILEELRDRAQRARLENVAIGKEPSGEYDGVLVDAPCSGSGTWRRQPHLKWYLRSDMIAAFAAVQQEILAVNARRVKSGGQLVYATCSLSHHENKDVVTSFLNRFPEYVAEKPSTILSEHFDGLGSTLLPGTRNTDGFYVAVLRKR